MVRILSLIFTLIGGVSLAYSVYIGIDYVQFAKRAVATHGIVRSVEVRQIDVGTAPGMVGKYSMMKGHFGGSRIVHRPLYTVDFQDESGRQRSGTLFGTQWLSEGSTIEFSYSRDEPEFLRQPENESFWTTLLFSLTGAIVFLFFGITGIALRRENTG